MGGYRHLFDASVADPEGFWAQAARAVSWTREPRSILDDSKPAVLPVVSRREAQHLRQRTRPARRRRPRRAAGADLRLPLTGTQRIYTYRRAARRDSAFAGVLRSLGVGKGDRVVIYMPMIPEAVIAMLACARLGAVHSVVFGGFAAHELATRIDDAQPAVIVSASCGIEPSRVVEYKPMLDPRSRRRAHPPRACVIVQRDRHRCELVAGRDLDWHELMATRGTRRPGAGRRHRSAVRALHLGHHRQAQGHRARQRRPRSRAAVEHAQHLRHRTRATCSGPPPTWAGSSATPTSCTARCCRARRPSSTRASRWARRIPARSGAWSPNTG